MKIFRCLFGDTRDAAAKSPSSTKRNENGADLHGELCLPTDALLEGHRPPSFPLSAGFGNSEPRDNSDAAEETDATLALEGRHWPKLLPGPRTSVSALENTIKEQSAELTLRCVQVADLCNIREQQAAALVIARDEIDRLSKSIAVLQDTIAQQETEAAAAKQKLILSDKEEATLRAQLDKALNESAELLQRLLSAETAFNDREIAITSAQESVEPLKAELAAKTAETVRLAAALEEANQRPRNELDQQRTQFENQVRKLEAVVAERDMQVKDLEEARAKIAERCDNLAEIVDALENTQQHARERIESQAGHVELLEQLLKVEREAAELKIRELTAELQRERLEHSAAERASAAMRKDIVLLLPKLAARRYRPAEPEPEISISQDNAA
jgi:DNA repair exonuclease SbcCD ATPase subunit